MLLEKYHCLRNVYCNRDGSFYGQLNFVTDDERDGMELRQLLRKSHYVYDYERCRQVYVVITRSRFAESATAGHGSQSHCELRHTVYRVNQSHLYRTRSQRSRGRSLRELPQSENLSTEIRDGENHRSATPERTDEHCATNRLSTA